jgi:hypothetical protein
MYHLYLSVLVTSYVIKVWPFKNKIQNVSELVNEASLVLFTFLVLPMTYEFKNNAPNRKLKSMCAWILIAVFILVLL